MPDKNITSSNTEIPADLEITDAGRNGLITAIGIILGFALTFIARYSMAPGDWKLTSNMIFVLMMSGIFTVLYSLYRVLIPYKITVSRYESTAKIFLVGILICIIAFALAVR